MRIFLPLIAFSFLLLTSCNQMKTTSAIEYNDQIINEQSKVIKLTLEFVKMIDTDLDGCEAKRQEIVKQVETSIGVIEKMEPFEGNSELKNAALDLFRFYKKVYSEEYKMLLEMLTKGDEITQEDIDKITEISGQVQAEETKLDAAFSDAQSAFAKKYNVQIEENALQKDIDAI